MYTFNYHHPSSLDEAVALFEGAADPVFLAGGHTLLPAMKQRLQAPSDVIDLSGVPGLSGIEVSADSVTVGALTTHADVAESAALQDALPSLALLASGIGDAQVRNRGTIGGSVANADPAADYPAALVGLGATVVTNRREIAADDFFTGMFETALEPGELLTAVRFPRASRAAYAKFPNPASRYAMTGVFVSAGDSGVRVAVTGAAASVFRFAEMETALATDLSPDALGGILPAADDLLTDMHASAEYRANLVNVMAQRAVASL